VTPFVQNCDWKAFVTVDPRNKNLSRLCEDLVKANINFRENQVNFMKFNNGSRNLAK
jgi:hypothetical protein